MARGKKQQRPAIGMPTRVLVMPVAGGGAQSTAGIDCGRSDPAVTGAAQTRAIAAETVTAGARERRGRNAGVGREPRPDDAWAGRVRAGAAR
ncbi:hypothetical protein [Streptomyces sp. NPDC054849]